jgi:hypothetical protein
MIQRDSVAAFEASRENNSVNLTVAAHVLGLGETRLRECIQDLLPGSWKTTGGVWRVPRQGLEELLNLGSKSERIRGIDTQEVVTLSAALRFMQLTTNGLMWLVNELQSGRELLLGKMIGLRGIASWIVSRKALDRAKASSRVQTSGTASSLTLPQLAKRWRVKQEVVYALHRSGALVSQCRDGAGYRGKMVSLTEVERFEATFVSARRLADTANRSPRRLIKHLGSKGIRPRFGGDGTSCRQHIYCVDETLIKAIREMHAGGSGLWKASLEDGL